MELAKSIATLTKAAGIELALVDEIGRVSFVRSNPESTTQTLAAGA
jgi:hypothetical protein